MPNTLVFALVLICTLSYLINMGPCLFFFKNLLYLHTNNPTPAFFVFIELGHSRQGIFNRCINLFFNTNNSKKLNKNHYLCLFQVLRFSSFFPNHHVYSVLHLYQVVKSSTDLPCLILNFFIYHTCGHFRMKIIVRGHSKTTLTEVREGGSANVYFSK